MRSPKSLHNLQHDEGDNTWQKQKQKPFLSIIAIMVAISFQKRGEYINRCHFSTKPYFETMIDNGNWLKLMFFHQKWNKVDVLGR